jgi:hypothetical protein
MKISELNIPQIELERFAYVHDYQNRLFLQYSEIIEKTDVGKKLVEILSSDKRVQALLGKMISKGSFAQIFEIKTLGMWFLWYANKVSIIDAEKALNLFLDSQDIGVFNTLWVLGLKIDQTIELFDGVRLIPAEEMVDSRDKESFLQYEFDINVGHKNVPEAALVCSSSIPKIMPDMSVFDPNIEFFKTSQKLSEIAQLVNLLPGISCWPYYSTSYAPDSVPFGPFSGSGGGMGLYDVLGFGKTAFPTNFVEDLSKIYKAYSNLSEKEKGRWQRIMGRLSQAKRRMQVEDKILDIGISLEMMLLEDNKNNDQLSLSFRLRGSWLISQNGNDRAENFQTLKEIYEYRSQVAHAGILEKGDSKKIKAVQENFGKYQRIAEKIGMRLLITGKPDWSKLILGTT